MCMIIVYAHVRIQIFMEFSSIQLKRLLLIHSSSSASLDATFMALVTEKASPPHPPAPPGSRSGKQDTLHAFHCQEEEYDGSLTGPWLSGAFISWECEDYTPAVDGTAPSHPVTAYWSAISNFIL